MSNVKLPVYKRILNQLLINQSNQVSEIRSQARMLPHAQSGLPLPPTLDIPPSSILTNIHNGLSDSDNDSSPLIFPVSDEIAVPISNDNDDAANHQNNTQNKKDSSLHKILHNVIKEIPEGKSVAYVNIATAELLAIATLKPLPPPVFQFIAAATSELFNAPNVIKVSNLFKEHKGRDLDKSNFHEMIIRGDGDIYVFIRAKSNDDRVAVFACYDTVAYGLVLHQARLMMPQIEAAEHLPD